MHLVLSFEGMQQVKQLSSELSGEGAPDPLVQLKEQELQLKAQQQQANQANDQAELAMDQQTLAMRDRQFYDRLQAVEVVLDGEGNGFEAEVIATAEHKSVFVAKERGEDMYAAVDLVMDKVERQLTKHKERFRNRKHQGARGPKAGGETETSST